MHVVSTNVVRGRLSKNYLTRKFIARNIFDMKYSRFTVYSSFCTTISNYQSVHTDKYGNFLCQLFSMVNSLYRLYITTK